MPKLVAQLVTWNGAKYLPYLFACLRAQTLRDWELIVIDNGSIDGTPEVLTRVLHDFPVPFRFIQNSKNRGFAAGHNQALEATSCKLRAVSPSAYVQLLNQDVILAPEYFEWVLAYMEANPGCAAAQGMLCRWDFKSVGTANGGRTDVIDTIGLQTFRNHRVVDWMTGVPLSELTAYSLQLTAPIDVFGVSGALPMYRRAALLDVALQESGVRSQGSGLEIFDEDFFSYKEDVDLAFRLRLAGWDSALVPTARAWHDRTAAGPSNSSDAAVTNDRRSKSAFVRYHSYKNHLFVLVKNEPWSTFWRDAPAILWYEWKKFVYILFREPETLCALGEVVRLLPTMIRKRRIIMRKRKATNFELRYWYA